MHLVQELVDRAAERARARGGRLLVGVAGGVAVGKSTLAVALADGLRAALPGTPVEVVATDGFLRPNRDLEAAGLNMKKGFPDTYDRAAFHAFLGDLAAGRVAVTPVYSHVAYDIVPGETRAVDGSGVTIVEGINVLQTDEARALFGLALYVDADPEHVKIWYLRRLDRIVANEPESLIARIADPAQRASLIDAAWTHINLVNLREHIAPTAAYADVVVRKGGDHAITEIVARRGATRP